MVARDDTLPDNHVQDFNDAMKNLNTESAIAKDNSKFLNTLDRQFKILQEGDLANIEQCLSSLLNGLRLVFVISRHFKTEDKMGRLLTIIANEIIHKVKAKVNIEKLLRPDPGENYERKLGESAAIIEKGMNVLRAWVKEYSETKDNLESEGGGDRWDYPPTEIKNKPQNMCDILARFKNVTLQLQRLLNLLGPKLKSVTGNTSGIDKLVRQAMDLVLPFIERKIDYFGPNMLLHAGQSQENSEVQNLFKQFSHSSEAIQKEATLLIEGTFKHLRSSESGFEFLQKFQVDSLETISQNIKARFSDVLNNYGEELKQNEDIFLTNKERNISTKNKPPVAGAIAWKKSILKRIKAPMVKFMGNSTGPGSQNSFTKSEEFQEIATEYKRFFNELDEYQDTIFNKWKKSINDSTNDLLTKTILKKGTKSEFEVNLPTDFRVLLNEAKYLDRMVPNVPKRILNIALQEEEYYRTIDKIEKMLREYNSTVNGLKDIERNLLKNNLDKLRKKLEPGVTSYYLNSLGINDFIESCKSEIKQFNDKRNKVDEKTRNIEDIIRTIEEARIIKDYNFAKLLDDQMKIQKEEAKRDANKDITKDLSFQSIQDFISKIEKEMTTEVDTLADKYLKIGSAMLPQIAMAVFEASNKGEKHEDMRLYYYYWERRVYNSLVKMIVRALLTFKALLSRRKRNSTVPAIPLFKVVAEFTNNQVLTNPNQTEISSSLENLKNSIINTAARFPRWKDGTCICVEVHNNDKGIERGSTKYTFAEEISTNMVVVDISAEIKQIVSDALERMDKVKKQKNWEIPVDEIGAEEDGLVDSHRKGLFSQKYRMRIEKWLEKLPFVWNFECHLDILHNLYKEYEGASDQEDVDFIKIDFTKVKKTFENQCKDRIVRIAQSLIKIVDKEAEDLKQVILKYYNEIRKEEGNRGQVKECLNTLAKIRDSTEDKEFEISELIEKCEVLKKFQSYGINFDEKKFFACKNLGKMWTNLLYKAKQKHETIKDSIKTFENQTQAEVKKLQDSITKLFDLYVKTGPTAIETSLNEGLEKIEHFKEEVRKLNETRIETVKMQKLFGMDPTPFPNLVRMDDELKRMDVLYSFYGKIKEMISELSSKQWEKFESKELEEIKRLYKSKVREFKKEEKYHSTVLAKLEQHQSDFEKPLAYIEKIKSNPHFKDNHWERLLKLIDKPTEGINFSQITLQQVLNLNLHDFQDKVDEVMAAANNEYKNKKELSDIETYWRTTANFEVADHKKGGYKVKVDEEIKNMLDEHLNTLQGIEGSKFAGNALKAEVKRWMDYLIKIQETIEEWIKVQTKWLYLEGIYIGNEDIRTQLSKETKTFEQHHKTFKNLNEKVAKNKNIMNNCVINDTTLAQLQNLLIALDKSQKSLTDYLNSKKKVFARFYFISDEDLLSILGSSEVSSIQPQLNKLFDNVKCFVFDKTNKVSRVVSEEDESFGFFDPYKPEGPVEVWMTKVDEIMIQTLHKLTKEGVFNYAKMERVDWMKKYIGMIVLVTKQIWWTWRVEDVFRKVAEQQDKYAMKKEAESQTKELKELIDLVRSDLESEDPTGGFRRKINNMIIISVHERDIVDRFVRDSILTAKEFEWESQLRFYWRNNFNDIHIEQCTGKFRYGYEYQGLTTRLVITPLTDRCVMTLTTALTFYLGGAPAGPAGTGKTETCKDLGKNLAVRAVVTNCGENFDVLAMGTNYSGLCQTGFWGVFDEFNRILPEVLSVVSTQIGDIQRALVQGKSTVEILDEEVNLKPTVGIFVTMNPGYEGRSELPDNLKALFRPVTMVVPDLKIICENMLMSEGFQEARLLAKKMTVLYQLSKEQLSKQYHYDFGLRALKSVLVMAGSLKRGSPELPEEDVLMRALRDMNMPKFVFEDVELFKGLLDDLFPGKNTDSKSNKDMIARIIECQKVKGLQGLEIQAQKVVQLKETMDTRHTTMVVGPTGAGKTTIIDLLKDERTTSTRNVVYYLINPKAQGLSELYGVLDPQTREWKDGILSKTFKFANEDLPERGPTDKAPKSELRWILFDGDVDAVWVENMNSVMDDNKLLTLSNGDRIKLKGFCKLLFEVFDLQYASPATISRCGMVYVDPKNLGYEHYFNTWRNKLIDGKENKEQLLETFNEFYGRYIKGMVDYVLEGKTGEDAATGTGPIELSISRTNLNMVQQFTNLMDCLLPDDINSLASEPTRLESMFIYACVWSFGACIKNESASDAFSQYLKGISAAPTPEKSLYDCLFDGLKLDPASNRVTAYVPPPDDDYSKILVPTVDTIKFNHLLNLFMSKGKATLFVGEPGTAKTVIIKNYISNLKLDSYVILNMNFSSRTDSLEVQRNIESATDKRRPGIYGPKGNKKLVVFIDELHMPIVDKYGTQQPIALLKFLLDKKLMYERGGVLERREYRDCQYVTALLPPGGGYNSVDPRFLSLFNCINIQFPKEKSIETIYDSILGNHFKTFKFAKEFDDLCKDVTKATYKLYQRVSAALPRSPIKFHYVFNLRDLSKLYQGLLRSRPTIFNTREGFVRLWKNECIRVFVDKLITNEDKKTVEVDILNGIMKETFGEDIMKKMNEGDFLYGDFKESQPLEPDFEDPQIYQNMDNFAKVRTKCEEMLEQYNSERAEMPLTLFNYAVDHLVRLIRILKFPRGNAMLVGVGGSGKQSLTNLATFICSYELYLIQVKKNYGEAAFRKDLLDLYAIDDVKRKKPLIANKTVFMFTDTQIVDPSFLELINTMLTVGVVNNLFDGATRKPLTDFVTDKLKKTGSADELWEIVCDTLRNNLHIVLCMSPAGDTLRVNCRNFPGLISNTTIDWFFAWPAEALESVAKVYIKGLNLQEDMFNKIVSHFVDVHLSMPEYSRKYALTTRRKVFNTPKNYLDFLKCYLSNLDRGREVYEKKIKEYDQGLEMLAEATEEIKKLQTIIASDNEIVKAEQENVNKLLQEVKEKKKIGSEKEAVAKVKEEQLTIKQKEIAEKQLQANQLFASKEPELIAAKEKVKKIDKGNLVMLCSMPKPPKPCDSVGELMQIFNINSKCDPKNPTWATTVITLKESTILNDLAEYQIENCSEGQIRRAIAKSEEILTYLGGKSLTGVSSAIETIFSWAQSTISLFDVFKEIKKLKENVSTLNKEQQELTRDLNQTKADIADLKQQEIQLTAIIDESQKKLKELNKKVAEMDMKLNNAKNLLKGLADEKIRWETDRANKQQLIEYLEGECLLCASFLGYFGPFDQEFRRAMSEQFKKDIVDKQIKMRDGFKVELLLTSDVQVTQWNYEGLPSDELSIQNGILTTQPTRYPLCIDPQLQAVKWIKKRDKNISSKYTTNFNDPDMAKKLEIAFREGDSILIENVGEEIDPIIDNILLKKYVTIGGVPKVVIGDKEVDVPMGGGSKDFIVYMTSKLPNPTYTPEIMGKTSVINYTVNMSGLTDQLLSVVVRHVDEKQDDLRNDLIKETSRDLSELARLQAKILSELVKEGSKTSATDDSGPIHTLQGNKEKKSIIENVDLIKNLQDSNDSAKNIQERQKISKITQTAIEAARMEYEPAAKHGAILFFCMQKMNAVSDMYQYSLSSYLEVFKRALDLSNVKESTGENASSKVAAIIEKLTQNVYRYVTWGIFKNHRRIYTFQMVLMIKDGRGQLNRKELDFFLKGNTKIGDSNSGKFVSWLSETNCKDIESLVEVGEVWKDFSHQLTVNEEEWKAWFNSEDPENVPLPEYYKDKINKFQLLLILRVTRPDRISLGIDNLIVEELKEQEFIQVPPLNDKDLLNLSNEKAPIIYILSPGADPSSYIRTLATNRGFTGKKFMAVSLGQGMEEQAYEYVNNAYSRGYWVLLQNCDLLPKCIKVLEKKLEGESKPPHESFRLWMTTQPTKEFPLGLLQNALKIVTEPPAGIKNNMNDVINRITDEQLNMCPHPAYKQLTYVLIFMHSVILDRAKYGKIGWNVTYDFNYSDFLISFKLLNLYLTKSQENKEETMPWESLKYLIGEAMYGGRVTDDFDRRTLMTYLDEYMGDFLFDKNHKFYFAEISDKVKYELYSFVDKNDLEKEKVIHLPNADSPIVFGLNSNAEITYYTNDAKSLWVNFLKMESVGGSSISAQERDALLEKISLDLLEKTIFEDDPKKMRINKEEADQKPLSPTEVVLFQEMDRFKILANKIQSSLNNLIRALNGKIGMNAELDDLAISLYNSFLPGSWGKLAPATEKKLGSWINHFQNRRKQYKDWYAYGEPSAIWLSGLHIPESYLTALVQAACRRNKWALDKSTLYTEVTTFTKPEEIREKPLDGCYVIGLYLEGIAWDMAKNSVRAQHPKELIHEMPILRIVPIEFNKLKLKDSIKIPVYITQNRRNAKGVGHVFDADLNTDHHPSHWILQGAALVLNTDE
jgi:dynein heavy chain